MSCWTLDLPLAAAPLVALPLLALGTGERPEFPSQTPPSFGPASTGPDGPLPFDQEARPAPTLTTSALRDEAEEIAVQLAELAGALDAPDVDVELVTRAQLDLRARAEFARTYPRARLTEEERAARLFGMLGPEDDLAELLAVLLTEQLGGLHDRSSGRILVASDTSWALARLVLAHELSQVLTDAGANVERDTTDGRLALQAVREARGMLLLSQWARAHLGRSEIGALFDDQARRAASSADLPPYVWKPILGLYSQGRAFLARQARIGPLGAAPLPVDVARAGADPPQTCEELLHPDRYWDDEKRRAVEAIEIFAEGLPGGWRIVHRDVLGELVLALLAMPLEERGGLVDSPLGVVSTRFTSLAADGWNGDRLVVVSNGGASLAKLVVRFDTTLDADECAAAIELVLEGLELDASVTVDGFWLTVVAAEGLEGGVDGSLGQRLDSALRVQP